MADSNHQMDHSKCVESSYPNDISEEDLKLIHHLNWLYGGYKMRNRKDDLVYNETKIFRKVQKELDVVMKSHTNSQKRGRGRPPKSEKTSQNNSKINKTNFNRESKSYINLNNIDNELNKVYNKNDNNYENLNSNKYYKNKNILIKDEPIICNNKYKNQINNQENIDEFDILSVSDFLESDEGIGEQLINSRNLLNRRLRFGYGYNLNDHRRPTWPQNYNLKDKIEYFINKKIADVTEFRIREPTTLSICNQFALQNHEAMVADSDRVHYYRAAIFWTGHNNEDTIISLKNNILDYGNNSSIEINNLEQHNKLKNEDRELLEVKNNLNYYNYEKKQQENEEIDKERTKINKKNEHKSLYSLNGLCNFFKENVYGQMSSESTEISYPNSQNNLNYNENDSDNLYSENSGINTNDNSSNISSFYEMSLNSNYNSKDNTSNNTDKDNNSNYNSDINNNDYLNNLNNMNYYCSNKKILEIGTGPMCVLAMNAVKAGAKSVDALEVSVPASRLAGKLMAAYGFNNIIKVFNTHSKLFVFDQNKYFKNSNNRHTHLSPKSVTPKFKRKNINSFTEKRSHNNRSYENNLLEKENNNAAEYNNNYNSKENNVVAENNLKQLDNNYYNYEKKQENNNRNENNIEQHDNNYYINTEKQLENDNKTEEKNNCSYENNLNNNTRNNTDKHQQEEKERNTYGISEKQNNYYLEQKLHNYNNLIITSNNSSNERYYSKEEAVLMLPHYPPYDMVISEILGDFASQEGVADVFLDFQRRILFENKRFIDIVKSIPCKASTMFVPSFFPDSSNIINKTSADPEMTIFSPSKKMLQSVGMRIDNLPVCNEWLPLEHLDLEKWMLPQMCQHYLNLFKVSTHGEVAGLLLGIDVEIRPGEHFGTRYGQCESWYTNFLLFDNEYTVFENDLILVNSVANLTNYVKANCDGTKIDVSKPSYSFQVYILSPIDMTEALSPKNINQNKFYRGEKSYNRTTEKQQDNNNKKTEEKENNNAAEYNNHLEKHENNLLEMQNNKGNNYYRSNTFTIENNMHQQLNYIINENEINRNNYNEKNKLGKQQNEKELLEVKNNLKQLDNNYNNYEKNQQEKYNLAVNNNYYYEDKEQQNNIKSDDKNIFNLNTLLYNNTNKDNSFVNTVKIPCKELMDMSYDIRDVYELKFNDLNKKYHTNSTSCSMANDVLNGFNYVQFNGNTYKVIHKPPPIYIDYHEQTSTIYYDTPCAKRKMHTDPPKRYSKIKFKAFK